MLALQLDCCFCWSFQLEYLYVCCYCGCSNCPSYHSDLYCRLNRQRSPVSTKYEDDEDDGTGTSADPRAVLPLRFKVERRGRFGRSGSSGSGGTSGGGTLKLITGVAYAMQLRLEPQWLELEDGVVELWLEGAEEVRGAWHVSVQRAWALCDRSKART